MPRPSPTAMLARPCTWPRSAGREVQSHPQVRGHIDSRADLERSEALAGDPAGTVARLKRGIGPDLLIQGSSGLYPALLGARLIDRLFLVTMPVILGRGKRLFQGDAAPTGLRLVDHRVASSGAVVTLYEQDADVPTGSFASQNPSAAELARREKIQHQA